MRTKKRFINIGMVVICLLIFGFGGIYIKEALAAKPIELIVDGVNITKTANPIIVEGRSLVPIRAVTEKLGGEVFWDGENKTVKIKKDGNVITLKIDSRLISYGEKDKTYTLTDIPPTIIGELTYVPLRLVSNALDIGITWNDKDRNIYVDSDNLGDVERIFDMEIISPLAGQVIEGEIPLQIVMGDIKDEVKEIKYLVLDPADASGFIVDRGELLTGEYAYSPKVGDNGEKVIVAALYDKNDKFLAGDAVGINVKVKPKVSLQEVKSGELVDTSIDLKPKMNFSPKYVKYEINNLYKDELSLSEAMDPYGSYRFVPEIHESGDYEFKLIAYDEFDKAYDSKKIKAKFYPRHELRLTGVKANMVIDKPVSLGAIRNFHVSETQFILIDSRTKKEEILSTQGFGNYTWFPGIEYKGNKELLVRVKDTKGKIHDSEKVSVILDGKPQLIVSGIGPKQVITSDIDISSFSNVKLDGVEYVLEDVKTGRQKSLASLKEYNSKFKFTPKEVDSGEKIFRAIAKYNGNIIKSEDIPVKIYLGKLYDSSPIIEKDKFLDFASSLAKESYRETNMSAAIQTAQAILETGWGQRVPTDKYTGKLSNNLFGIKGKADAGSVISNTWEEYNGTSYRIDAEFRAYNNSKDSWKDHKSLLLNAERYSIFRDVMYDSTKGAWAIKRAGYATDSKYPFKLMDIIDNYNLRDLDKIDI